MLFATPWGTSAPGWAGFGPVGDWGPDGVACKCLAASCFWQLHSGKLCGCLRAAPFLKLGRASHRLSSLLCAGVSAPAGGVAAEEVPYSARGGSTFPRKSQVRADALRSHCAYLVAFLPTWFIRCLPISLPLLLTTLPQLPLSLSVLE